MKEKLEQKIAALNAQKDQTLANLNFISGSIEALTQLLKETETSEPTNNTSGNAETTQPD